MTPWELAACLTAHSGRKKPSEDIDDEELREMGIEGF